MSGSALDELRTWREELVLWRKAVITVYLAIGACGGLVCGGMLAHEYPNWYTACISVLILEPIGLACALGFLFMLFPENRLTSTLEHALIRAGRAALVVGILFAGGLITMLGYALIEYWGVR